MYLRGSGKAVEMKHGAAISTMMAAFQQAVNNGHRNSLGWHLEEIHVTWAHLEKKRTRLRTCTKIHQEVLFSEREDGVAGIKRRRHDLSSDGVWILATASQRCRLKLDLEPSTWRRR
ncbi:hypothetical protein Tco_1545974 [Tanacetum coccineum]